LRSIALFMGASVALFCAAPQANGAFETPIGDQRLDALAARYFAQNWKLSPIAATETGVHDYDALLPDLSADGFAARIAFVKRTLAELRAIDPTTYGADASYDARILDGTLERDLLNLQERQTWRHNPAYYTGQASAAVFTLLTRDFAPLRERMRLVIARERLIPAMLEKGKPNITTVDATTARLADLNIRGTISFFETTVPLALAGVRDAGLQGQFKSANEAAIAALRAYLADMEAGPLAHPSGTFAIGAKLFERLLDLQELSPITLGQYEQVGSSALAQTRIAFVDAAKAIDPTRSPGDVVASLGAKHPTAETLLKTASDGLAALRRFVIAHNIITLPPDYDIEVVATPEFERQTSFASMDAPGPLEKVATKAYYNVTPVDPSWTAKQKEDHLAFFNDYAFPIVSLHEVMPGHYVNFALDKHEKLSMIRRIESSVSFEEGWAHYDEQMMVDQGWGGDDPRVRLEQLKLALQRECRFLVGLREHTQNLSVEDATKFFEDNAFMTEGPARREALRGTEDPLYGYYTLGKLEILKLRDDYKAKLGSKYTLQGFHDALLAHGDPPIAIVRRIMLGVDDDGKLL
jgi:uncharacterized protein (DUF885 family)